MGLSHDAALVATAIAKGESGWNTDAHNPVGRDDSYGLWQINRKAHGDRFGTGDQLRDIMANARAMASLSANGTNWQPWTVYTNDSWRKHMPAAREAAAAVALKPSTPAGWEDVARTGAGIPKGLGLGGIPQLLGDVAANPGDVIAGAGEILNIVNPFDDLIDFAGVALRALTDPAWWRRIGVGALGVLLLAGGAIWLGRDLIADAAASLVPVLGDLPE